MFAFFWEIETVSVKKVPGTSLHHCIEAKILFCMYFIIRTWSWANCSVWGRYRSCSLYSMV